MIRRDLQLPDGRAGWALISQVEHARLSGEMAAAWGSRACPKPQFAGELLPAIDRHDDGWAAWEQQPGVDPTSGKPLNFTEMPLDESLAIWERSIQAAAAFGPLAGYVVSGHFAALLRHQNAWQKLGTAHAEQARGFLDEQARRRIEWFVKWQRKLPARHTAEAAEKSLHWLQFFDALSLWLCMSRRVDPAEARRGVKEVGSHQVVVSFRSTTLSLPGGGELRLEPIVSTPQEGEWIEVSPWPFATRRLDLKLSARCVPVQHYATPLELEQAPSATVMLNWRLVASREDVPSTGESTGEGENP